MTKEILHDWVIVSIGDRTILGSFNSRGQAISYGEAMAKHRNLACKVLPKEEVEVGNYIWEHGPWER